MEYDFNHPSILKGYLEQAKPQYGLEDVKGIVVGKSGGLAYHLFADEGGGLPREFQITSFDSMNKVKKYFNEFEEFLYKNEKRALATGFLLVSINPNDNRIFNGRISPLDIYCAGIGDDTIENVQKFEKFLYMVKTNYQSIQEECKKLKGIFSTPIIIKEELNLNKALTLE